ncbi:hypothetical protein TSAR_013839, partial [Trichomalopsis sarcophagae]
TVPAKSSKHFASFKKESIFPNHLQSQAQFGISLQKVIRLKNSSRNLERKNIWYINPRCARPKET